MREAAIDDWLPALPFRTDRCFAQSYADARRNFRNAAVNLGAAVKSYVSPLTGPDGGDLTADLVWFGAADAAKVMVMTSATHGVEGFCGSGAQVDFMLSGGPATLPEDTAALLVHAINPWGFAWLRRVTQENVDLNRNGVDFDGPLPDNPGYSELQEAFSPPALQGPAYEAAKATIAAYRARHGEEQFAIARGSGQHVDDKGIHFGGFESTWSRRTMETFIEDYGLARRRQVAVIDYHTGLGPFGYGEPICGCRPEEPGRELALRWYGESMTEPLLGTSTSVVIPGLVQYVWRRQIGAERLAFIALEYGTYSRDVVRGAGDAEHWLFRQGLGWDDPRATAIRAEFRRAYFPDTPSWKEMILMRSRQIVAQTLQGLDSLG